MLATQAAIAIENARLYRRGAERSARFRALSELSRKVTASLDSQQVFDYAVQAAVDSARPGPGAALGVAGGHRPPARVGQRGGPGPPAARRGRRSRRQRG